MKLFNVYVSTKERVLVVQLNAEDHDQALEVVKEIIPGDYDFEVRLKSLKLLDPLEVPPATVTGNYGRQKIS